MMDFNNGRKVAFQALKETLEFYINKENTTEKTFFDMWQRNIVKEGNVIADGWYCPPPKGMAVLFGDRISFDSLRNQQNWVSDVEIDWKNDMFYGYCSPVDKQTGRIGDIAVTLYFGRDKEIIEHIKKCYQSVSEIFSRLDTLKNSKELFDCSQEIFQKYRLKNSAISKTDIIPMNLGHTFPRLEGLQNKDSLTDEEKGIISKARKFINESSCWDFEDDIQFTVEPQLVSLDNPELPKIAQHYLIKKTRDQFIVCRDIDELINKYVFNKENVQS